MAEPHLELLIHHPVESELHGPLLREEMAQLPKKSGQFSVLQPSETAGNGGSERRLVMIDLARGFPRLAIGAKDYTVLHAVNVIHRTLEPEVVGKDKASRQLETIGNESRQAGNAHEGQVNPKDLVEELGVIEPLDEIV